MTDFEEIRDQVRDLRREMKMIRSNEVESNAIVREERSDAPTDGPIQVAPLLLLEGKLNGVSVRI